MRGNPQLDPRAGNLGLRKAQTWRYWVVQEAQLGGGADQDWRGRS